jgi:hypothetical protein
MINAALNRHFSIAARFDPRISIRVVGGNVCRFLLCTALVLYFSVPAATAGERYGEWLLEQPRTSVLTLTFKQSIPRGDKLATSELGFVCDKRDGLEIVGAVLIPV